MWVKKGMIFNVEGKHSWDKSHAQVPVIDILDDRYRIYYATRNSLGQSNISFIEVKKNNPSKIIYEHPKVLLNFGSKGTFDESGIMPSSIINVGTKKYMYYIGWSVRKNTPFQNAIGLAISNDNGITFKKLSEGPIISVNHIEPYFSGTSYVLQDEGIFKMWYLSCIKWIDFEDLTEPLYNIKYAESDDGINWKQTGTVALDLINDEGGLASASVIKESGIYKMWFSKRNKTNYRKNIKDSYRIGYAESRNGLEWTRKPVAPGIDVSNSGWDSEMISYPYVVLNNEELLMFYNGNGFGKSGFGFATKNLHNLINQNN